MSSSSAREAILARLAASCRTPAPVPAPADIWSAPELDEASRLELLAKRLQAVRTEVHVTPEKQWKARLAELLAARKPATLAHGTGAWFAKDLPAICKKPGMPALTPYCEDVDQMKDALFGVEASITTARAGIAETGALLLTPDAGEPRLLSLVPPVHVVVLRARDIKATFAGAIRDLQLAEAMPANLVLISGPSKTADIELTLTFGVHGPKELVALILT